MVIRTDDSYDIVQADAVYPNYLELEVDETVKSLILVQKTTSSGSAVANLDGGMIYSQNNGSSIRMHLVLRNCSKTHAQNARMTVNYTDNTDLLNPVDTFKVFPLDTINENGSNILKNIDIISFAGVAFRHADWMTPGVLGHPWEGKFGHSFFSGGQNPIRNFFFGGSVGVRID